MSAAETRQSEWRFESGSVDETFEIGRKLGSLLTDGAVVGLVGDLGAGKTTFTKGLVCGAGCRDHHLVNSPTYVLEQIYQGACAIHHYDAYRLGNEEELLALGLEERLRENALIVIEWADLIDSVLPETRLRIEFELSGESSRILTITGSGEGWKDRLDRF